MNFVKRHVVNVTLSFCQICGKKKSRNGNAVRNGFKVECVSGGCGLNMSFSVILGMDKRVLGKVMRDAISSEDWQTGNQN